MCSDYFFFSTYISLNPISHLAVNFEVRHCTSALNPVIVRIEGDKEAQAGGGFDSEISSVIGKSGVRFLLIFFGNIAEHFRLEIIVAVASKGNRHIVELCNFLPLDNWCSSFIFIVIVHFRNGLNIVRTFDTIYTVKFRE